jgi:hypothetical protein
MKVSLEIPDKLYSKLVRQAKNQSCSLNALIVRAVEAAVPDKAVPRRRIKLPVIHSKRPGTLYLDNERIFELIDFP